MPDSDGFADTQVDISKKRVWKINECHFDPRATELQHSHGPRLKTNDATEILNEILYFLYFLPVNFLKETILTAINKNVS